MYIVSIKIFDTNIVSRSGKDDGEVIGIDPEPAQRRAERREILQRFSLQKTSAYCFLL